MKPLKGKQVPVQMIQFGQDCEVTPNFQQFMQEKMKQSDVRKVYEEAQSKQLKTQQQPPQPPQPANRIASKPFQIKSQTASGFNSNKKPFGQFYQSGGKLKSIDSSIPRPQSAHKSTEGNEKNHSVISTEKSYDVTDDLDSRSVKSENFSISHSSVENQNFKTFVDRKKKISAAKGDSHWVVNDPIKANLQTKEYKDQMSKVEKLVKDREQIRSAYQQELAEYLSTQKVAEQCKFKKMDEKAELEKQIQQLQTELREVEQQGMEKKSQIFMERLKQMIDEPMDNQSSKSFKEKSMFITELLRNRHNMIQNASGLEFDDSQSRDECQLDQISQLSSKSKKYNQNYEAIQPEQLPQADQDRLNALLADIDTFKPNQYCKDTPFSVDKEALKDLHSKIKKFNPNFKEEEDFGLDLPGILPKDPILRKEAMERILEQKHAEINDELLKLSKRQAPLEERPKMQALLENLKKTVKHQPSAYVVAKMLVFDRLGEYEAEAEEIIQRLSLSNVSNEFGELRQLLNQAIIVNREAQQLQQANDQTLVFETQKAKLIRIEEEFENLYDQATNFFQQINREEQLEQEQEIEIEYPEEYIKSNAEYDAEITEILRKKMPELFDDAQEKFDQE